MFTIFSYLWRNVKYIMFTFFSYFKGAQTFGLGTVNAYLGFATQFNLQISSLIEIHHKKSIFQCHLWNLFIFQKKTYSFLYFEIQFFISFYCRKNCQRVLNGAVVATVISKFEFDCRKMADKKLQTIANYKK